MPLARQVSRVSVFALIGWGAAYAPAAPRIDVPLANATVIVIRHGEKPDEGTDLTPAGAARAKAYVGFFAKLEVDGHPFHVDHIVATKDSKGSHRERLTIEPLATALRLPVDLRFGNKAYPEMVEDLKTHAYGKGIVVCWHHGNIPALVTALGASPNLIPGDKWPKETFDWAVELKFDANGKIIPSASKVIHEHLMPGDSR